MFRSENGDSLTTDVDHMHCQAVTRQLVAQKSGFDSLGIKGCHKVDVHGMEFTSDVEVSKCRRGYSTRSSFIPLLCRDMLRFDSDTDSLRTVWHVA